MARLNNEESRSGRVGKLIYVNRASCPYVRAEVDKEKYRDKPLHQTTKRKSKHFGDCAKLVKNLKAELYAIKDFKKTGSFHNSFMSAFMPLTSQQRDKTLYHHLSNPKLIAQLNTTKIPKDSKVDSTLAEIYYFAKQPNKLQIKSSARIPKAKYITNQLSYSLLFGYININRYLQVSISDLQSYIFKREPEPGNPIYQHSDIVIDLPNCTNSTHKVHIPFLIVQYLEHPQQTQYPILEHDYTAIFILRPVKPQ